MYSGRVYKFSANLKNAEILNIQQKMYEKCPTKAIEKESALADKTQYHIPKFTLLVDEIIKEIKQSYSKGKMEYLKPAKIEKDRYKSGYDEIMDNFRSYFFGT